MDARDLLNNTAILLASPSDSPGTAPSVVTAVDQAPRKALAKYDRLLAETVFEAGGEIIDNAAREFRAVFDSPSKAVHAALAAQEAIRRLDESDSEGFADRLRMALVECPSKLGSDGRTEIDTATLSALVFAAHGGQVLVSDGLADRMLEDLPDGAVLRDLGVYGIGSGRTPARIWQLCHPDLPNNFPAPYAADLSANNLPVFTTSFIGRKGEIVRTRAALKANRVVSLVGEQGIGKTRLAVEVASSDLVDYPDGVWIASLGPLTDACQPADTVAAVFGLHEEPGRQTRDTLAKFIGTRRMLVILDDYDAALPECASLVQYLTAKCSELTILATGSQSLRIEIEHVCFVAAMGQPPLPGSANTQSLPYSLVRYEAARLFIERARNCRPGYRLTEEDGAALCRLCHDLGGVPLAIELAAAHSRSVSAEQISAHVAREASLTSTGARSNRSCIDPVRVILDWTFVHMELKEKILLLRLSVFVGAWDLQDAVEVCSDRAHYTPNSPPGEVFPGETPSLIERLVERGLVAKAIVNGSPQFTLPRDIAEYCRERRWRSRDDAALRLRHLSYYFRLARTAESGESAPKRTAALERMTWSYHNVRAAMAEALDQAMLPAHSVPSGAVDRLLHFADAIGQCLARSGRYGAARAFVEAALIAPGARDAGLPRAHALLAAAKLALLQGKFGESEAYGREAAQILRGSCAASSVSAGIAVPAPAARPIGSYCSASEQYIEAVTLTGATAGYAGGEQALEAATQLAWIMNDRLGAAETMGRTVAIRRGKAHDRAVAAALNCLARSALDRLDLVQSRHAFVESLALWLKLADRHRTALVLEFLALLACVENRATWAVSLYATAYCIRADADTLLSESETAERDDVEERLHPYIDTSIYEPTEMESMAMSLDTIVASVQTSGLRVVEGGKPDPVAVLTAREVSNSL